MKRALATTAMVLLLAGCGSTTPPSNTGTATGKRVASLQQLVTRYCFTTHPRPQCGAWFRAYSKINVTVCTPGITTDSGCVFARNVRAAYQHARRVYGRAPTGITVTRNPVQCGTSGRLVLCRSRINHRVWVRITL